MKTLARWCEEYTESIRKTKEPCFFDKLNCSVLTAESYAYFKSGEKERASELIKEALGLAVFFDSAEEKTTDIIKLFDYQKDIGSFTLLGETAMESVKYTVDVIGDKKFTAFRNRINR